MIPASIASAIADSTSKPQLFLSHQGHQPMTRTNYSANPYSAPFFARTLGICLITLSLGTAMAEADLEVGATAPDFRLQDQAGEWHTLENYKGKWVALYFYPKDDTPGCTKEACAFRDNIFAFEEIGATIIGVSLDDTASHKAFAEKYSLPFTILSDPDGNTAKSYGVLKSMGTMQFAERQSFIIGPDGTIRKHYPKVNAEQHSAEVLADLKAIM
jgi:peroxiredoxin Q/BCP